MKSNGAVILNTAYDYKDVSSTKTTNFIESIRLSNDNGYGKCLSYAYDTNGNITNASGTVLGYNLYAYCENNPVNISDAWGYDAINIIFAAIGAVVGWHLGDYQCT